MAISGYMYPVVESDRLPATFFCRLPTSWGWATWQRAWSRFEPDAKMLWQRLHESGALIEFDLKGNYPYSQHLKQQASGELDVWGVLWYASVFVSQGLCLYPSHSLVYNAGMDGSGMHCGPSHAFDIDLGASRVGAFPDRIEECTTAVEKIGEFFRSLQEPALKRMMRQAYGRLLHLMRS